MAGSEFENFKAARAANDEAGAIAAVADAGELVTVELPEEQADERGANPVEAELRQRFGEEHKQQIEDDKAKEKPDETKKPEVKRDWRGGKVPPGVQKRFDQLTRERHEADQRAERAEQRLRELEAGQQQTPEKEKDAQKTEKEAATDPALQPRIEEGRKLHEDWDEVFERAKKDNIQIPQAAMEAAQKLPNHVDVFYTLAKDPSLAAELLKHPERSVAIVQEIGRGVAVTRAVLEAVNESENGEKILEHLQKNPEVGAKIGQMTPAQASREVIRLSFQLQGGGREEGPREKSRLPEPIKPIGGGSARSTVDPSDMDYQDYKKYRANGGGR